MARVLLLRHGESVANANPGSTDEPPETGDQLTGEGFRQALMAGEALREHGATRIITSPMRRAIQTGECVNEALELPMSQLDYIHELRESDDFPTMSAEQQKLSRFSVAMAENGNDPDYRHNGSESFNDVLGRVCRLQEELKAMPEGELPLVVTHGLFLRFFLFASLLRDDFTPAWTPRLWRMRSLNCGLSTFACDEVWHPVDPEIPGWSCISWMARPWDPAPRV